jgi:hypothetical protein
MNSDDCGKAVTPMGKRCTFSGTDSLLRIGCGTWWGPQSLALRNLMVPHLAAHSRDGVFNEWMGVRFECRMADRTLSHEPPPGSLAICPAGIDCAADRWRGAARSTSRGCSADPSACLRIVTSCICDCSMRSSWRAMGGPAWLKSQHAQASPTRATCRAGFDAFAA